MATPTVLQLQLGKELKRLREARGWTLAEAVEVLGNKATKLSRLENGQSSLRPLDIRILYEALGASKEETDWAFETAKSCSQRGRWSGFRSIYNKNFRMAVDLEQDASVIHHYQSEMVPGLLQTEEYMRAVFAADSLSSVKVDEGVRARLNRQEVLRKPNGPHVGFVLSESAVARVVGGEALMRRQLQHIAEVAHRPKVDLRVLPFRSKTFPAVCMFSFTIFKVPPPTESRSDPIESIYIENYDDGRYCGDRESIDAYNNMWRRFVEACLDPVQSRQMVLRLADGY